MGTTDPAETGGAAAAKLRTALRAATETAVGLAALLVNPRFYIGVAALILGILLNFEAQAYLQDYVNTGKTLPVLSDLILDHLPYRDVSSVYDAFSVVSLAIFMAYILHRRKHREIPYYLVVCGIFHIVRAVFIVLTPLGHPALFDGTKGPFNGFSKFELGVFPSGHVGISYMYFLLARGKVYRTTLIACVLAIVAALFLSRGHYSVDVLAGLFFAYAIRSFGDKYLFKRLAPPQESPLTP